MRDILLHLESYPDRISDECVDQAALIAASLGGNVTAIALHVRIPLQSNRLAEFVVHVGELARSEEQRSFDNAQHLLGRFRSKAEGVGVEASTLILRATPYEAADQLAKVARTHDLCVIPMGPMREDQQAVAEAVIFGSGRPAVVLPTAEGRAAPTTLSKIAIAWDGSRGAARAVADALPLLASASDVRVLTILDEKPGLVGGASADLIVHLQRHGVSAKVDERPVHGRKIGAVLTDYAAEAGLDLLVMGAYGHSRLREFVLGGATQAMLDNPPCPVLLSH